MLYDPSGHWAVWNNVVNWWNENHIGAYLFTGVEITVGLTATVVSAAAIIATGGTGGGFAWVSLAHGINSLSNGIRDAKNLHDGSYDKVGTENYLKDNFYELVGSAVGYGIGYSVDAVNYIKDSKNPTDYKTSFSNTGKTIGTIGYYGVDIFGCASGIKDSYKVLSNTSKLKYLNSTYYEAGNIMDGFKRVNDLKVIDPGVSNAYKGAAAIYSSVNVANAYYDQKDLNNKYGIWDKVKDFFGNLFNK